MLKVLTARLNPPKPSHQRFDGLTILLIGASGGIGLEAAKALAARGPATLFITARDMDKGLKTKTTIEEHLASIQSTTAPTIIPLVVDMASPDSIHALIHSLRQLTEHLDHAIISAGVLLGGYKQLATSYDASLQINAISPTLLSLLLLPFLLASPLVNRASVSERPHLTFVSSGAAWLTKISNFSPFVSASNPLQELSNKDNFPAGPMGSQTHYGRSKLMLEYMFRHVAFLPVLTDDFGKPKVLVASVCPGAVNSDLSRNVAENPLIKIFASAVNNMVARSPEQGSHIYLSSLTLGEEGRGEMWTDDHIVVKENRANIKSQLGKDLGERVWAETKNIVKQFDIQGEHSATSMLAK